MRKERWCWVLTRVCEWKLAVEEPFGGRMSRDGHFSSAGFRSVQFSSMSKMY